MAQHLALVVPFKKNTGAPSDKFRVKFFVVDFHGLKVKVRSDWMADYLCTNGETHSNVIDLKTTTGNVKDRLKIRNKIKSLNYDLSAALYLDVINCCIDMSDLDLPHIEDFVWVFTSKDEGGGAQAYSAKHYLAMGRAKYMKAINLIHHYEEGGWSFPEEVVALEPFGYELSDWIKPDIDTEIINESEFSDLL